MRRSASPNAPKTVKIPCRTCSGSGEEELPPAYRDTYAVLGHGWQTTTEILGKLKNVGQTALANRLSYLKRIGLAEGRASEKNFRMNEWKRL